MAGLGFEETELRLGLPGGGGSDAGDAAAARKRGFEETIDLKLKLEQPAAALVEKEAEEHDASETVAAADIVAAVAASPAAAATGGGNMKRSPSQSSVVTADAQPDSDDKPRAPKAQAVGWPPVRSFRKNILQKGSGGAGEGKHGRRAVPAQGGPEDVRELPGAVQGPREDVQLLHHRQLRVAGDEGHERDQAGRPAQRLRVRAHLRGQGRRLDARRRRPLGNVRGVVQAPQDHERIRSCRPCAEGDGEVQEQLLMRKALRSSGINCKDGYASDPLSVSY